MKELSKQSCKQLHLIRIYEMSENNRESKHDVLSKQSNSVHTDTLAKTVNIVIV